MKLIDRQLLQNFKNRLRSHYINYWGWQTNKKIVVFQSDDWGSIRMPSYKVFKKLLAKDIRVDRSIYDTYDTLENRADMESLLNILSNFKDRKGNYPIFTFNTVMGNPAFDKIEEDRFAKYHHEDLFTSYKFYNGDNIADLWHKAIDAKLIHPQFHAKEHLNVSLWMKALCNDHKKTKIAFNHRFFALKTLTPSKNQKNYLAAYWPLDEKDFRNKIDILEEGLEMFKSIFGFKSISFVACNYIYPKEMERSFAEQGVRYIQTQSGHISPDTISDKKEIIRNYTGQMNSHDQTYLVRNCTFEPTLDSNINTVESCIKEISTAFKWNKPAIISSHRINYVSGMSIENRDNGLFKLNQLLNHIIDKWPDVEFLSTNDLGNLVTE